MFSINPNTDISIQTGSGNINLNYQTAPANLEFGIASGSKDITARFKGANYSKETTSCKQGVVGTGEHKLSVNSDNGTVIKKTVVMAAG